jgi:hypothetical protein
VTPISYNISLEKRKEMHLKVKNAIKKEKIIENNLNCSEGFVSTCQTPSQNAKPTLGKERGVRRPSILFEIF